MHHRVGITTSYLEPGDEIHRRLDSAGFAVSYARPQDREASGQSLAEALAGVHGVIAGNDAFDAGVIGAVPDLRIIARTGVGYDNVDVEAASRHGVIVCTTPGANQQSVAELTLALMMCCARGIIPAATEVQAGGWTQRTGLELAGATLGVLGLGSIGKEVALLAKALGMQILAHDTNLDHDFITGAGIQQRSLPELLAESDVLTVHLALTPQTQHLIGAAALAQMKPGSFLINTSRGGVIDQQALADALHSGHLGGAGLDVLEEEPPGPGNALLQAPNLVITPHIGGATHQARGRSSLLAADQVIDHLQDRPVAHPVRPLSTERG